MLISVVGNASPFAIRSTSYCVPCEGQAALLSRLPLGALITPLVKQSAEEVSFSLLSLLHILLKNGDEATILLLQLTNMAFRY